jgi:hypothetical protein
MTDKCPNCDSTETWRDEVDVGVGIIYGPLHCNDCHYREPSAYDEDFDADCESLFGVSKDD